MGKKKFSLSLLKKKKTLKDIIWHDSLEYNKNNYYNIEEYCQILNNIKLQKKYIILGCHKNIKIYILTNKSYNKLYISIGICNPLFWYTFNNNKEFINKIIRIYTDDYNLNQLNLYKTILNVDRNINIKSILHNSQYLENKLWGSSWKDYPFRNIKLNESNKTNEIYNKILYEESLKQLNNIFTISCRTIYSKSIITIHNENDICFITIKYNKIKTEQNKIISKKFKKDIPNNLPIDVVLYLYKLNINSLTQYLKNSYLVNNNLNVVFKLKTNLFFSNDIIYSLKSIIKDLNDKMKKKNVRSFIKKNLINKNSKILFNINDIDIKNKNILKNIFKLK